MTTFPVFPSRTFALRILWDIARIIVALAFAVYCGVADSAEPVRVAYFGSLSGPFALQGEETLKNLQAAADFVNARGGALDGRKLEIVPFDNKGNPQESLIVIKQAIDRDIRFVVSGVSNVAHALSDALEKHNQRNPEKAVVFFDYGALDPALTEAKCSFWHFRFESHAEMQVGVLTDYVAKLASVKKVYLINQDYAHGQAVSRVSVDMLGLAKSGAPGVKHDAEGTGLGWKVEALIQARDTIPAVRCVMQRPPAQ